LHFKFLDESKRKKCLEEVLLCKKCAEEPWPFHKVCDKVPLKNVSSVWDPLMSYFFARVKMYAGVLKGLDSEKFTLDNHEKIAFENLRKFYQDKIFYNQSLIRLMSDIHSRLETL
jgi:hypothetical protein